MPPPCRMSSVIHMPLLKSIEHIMTGDLQLGHCVWALIGNTTRRHYLFTTQTSPEGGGRCLGLQVVIFIHSFTILEIESSWRAICLSNLLLSSILLLSNHSGNIQTMYRRN